MKVTLVSTSKVVQLRKGGQDIPARVWEGTTAAGIKCHAFIAMIAADEAEDLEEFNIDLQGCAEPSREIAAIPLRMVL